MEIVGRIGCFQLDYFFNLFFGLGSRLSHEPDIEEFDGATELWFAQQIAQAVLAGVVLISPFLMPNDLPIYTPLYFICAAMFTVNCLGLADEVFEIRHLNQQREELLKINNTEEQKDYGSI